MNLMPPRAAMERAFLAGDRSFDGLFVAGVRTTGIFCRPSCPARKPKSDHLDYFATPAEAATAGYRACRRCDPEIPPGATPAWLQPLFLRLESEPDRRWDGEALRALGLEPARVRRWFQQHHGMTFAAYCRTRRLGRALETIQSTGSLDEAALGHGYESHSGFREAFRCHFAQAPGAARAARCLRAEAIPSPLGTILLVASDHGLCRLSFGGDETADEALAESKRLMKLPLVPGESPILDQAKAELRAYFAGTLREFTVPLDVPGTEFQQRVWNGLRAIPYGCVRSYAELATVIGCPNGQRAVGMANGANRIAIIIPCHRVVNTGGGLGGYSGGLWRKRLLLELERTGNPLALSGTESLPATADKKRPQEPAKTL